MASSTPAAVASAVPREQYDELLGGQTCLPSTVSILHFANARSQEITALTEAIEDPQNKHLAFQRMPRHLRRRAMSHNVKRMPRRLRDIHLAQLEKSGLPVKGKRPSRKYRRRPGNLLREYNRRQRRIAWLETHIWHAKRFHMGERWGYRLPQFPNDKAFRACYRATAKHCLVQDVSYLNCIELKGPEEDILSGLRQLTSPECGLTFAAKATLGGTREGSVMTFRQGAYPCAAIGRVTFMWRLGTGDNSRTIWIWCHPAFYNELLAELISVFQFKVEESAKMEVDPDQNEIKSQQSDKKTKVDVEMVKLETKNIGRLPKYTNKTVAMTLLKDTFNRFRLTGPLAQVVLTEALKFVDIEHFIEKNSDDDQMDVDSEERPRSAWLKDFYGMDISLQALRQQKIFWEEVLKDINSADELPPRMIISATVVDPRLTMPSSRTKALNSGVGSVLAAVPEQLSRSPLWEEEVRDRASRSKMAVAQLNSLRSRAVVPGVATTEWLGRRNVSHLPLLLVQRPGDRGECRRGYGSGWDVIAPAGWGVPLWLGLVHRGARAGGLREAERLTLETASGPALPPDTVAGTAVAEMRRVQLRNKHFRLPPDKRPNYVKLGVVAPFHSPWTKLVRDWCHAEEERSIYVIRNRIQLEYLKCLVNKTKPATTCTFSDNDRSRGIVLVSVEMCGRGTIGECSMICTANKKDLKLTKNKSGRGPVEPQHEDENEERRKTERDTHLKKLKSLRRKRVKAKRELEDKGFFLPKERRKESPTEEIVTKQAEVMRELWLPSEINSLRNSSARCVIGFVTCGDYSFTRSCSFGYGYVALSALLSVLEKNQNHFLIRNVTSLQYYFVRLKILAAV